MDAKNLLKVGKSQWNGQVFEELLDTSSETPIYWID